MVDLLPLVEKYPGGIFLGGDVSNINKNVEYLLI